MHVYLTGVRVFMYTIQSPTCAQCKIKTNNFVLCTEQTISFKSNPSKMGSDSDSSSDDDNLALLREAADTEFINDKMFQSDGTKEDKAVTSTSKSLLGILL